MDYNWRSIKSWPLYVCVKVVWYC